LRQKEFSCLRYNNPGLSGHGITIYSSIPAMYRRFIVKKHAVIIVLFLAMLTGQAWAVPAGQHIYTFDDFINVKWVKDPQISPDGSKAAFVVERKLLKENALRNSLMLIDLKTKKVTPLTSGTSSDSRPRWSPDGSTIAFNSNRDGKSQIWLLPMTGGEARKLTNMPIGASDAEWSPDGKQLLFLSEAYPDCATIQENEKKLKESEQSPSKAQLISDIPYRVFDHWREGRRSHLYIVSVNGGAPKDLTPGNFDIPPVDLGGSRDYCFSPDGKEVCYVTNTDDNLAWSTNNDLFTVPAAGGKAVRLTDSKACDCNPRYSPDGKYIAYTAMKRPGFEADRRVVTLIERSTGKKTPLTDSLDRTIDDLEWTPDSRSIICSAEDLGYKAFYRADISNRSIRKLTEKTYNSDLRVTPDGKKLVFRRESMTRPPELFIMDLSTRATSELTTINSEEFSKIAMNPAEEFSFKAEDGLDIHGFIVKPPDFDPGKKYPLVYLIHGGPQGTWSDDFHQRWNTELFAAPGYVVAAINFRGSQGYGQSFTDQVSKNWGGMPYKDVMSGIDHIVKTCPYVDSTRLSAAGASYGGFMINWIMGHTDRFRTVICHSGVFNTISEYGTTEELWFPEWEFGGTPYDSRENYEKWNPVNHVKNFKTPCLVIHGEQDYRVPVSEGMQLFTALKRNNVPSKFLYFPDECHFIRKPQNLKVWFRTMLEWLDEWLKK